MSTTNSSGSVSGVEPMLRQLVERIDQDKNGQISTDEFGTFLTGLLKASGQSAAKLSAALDEGDSTTPNEVAPSQWTANNAPYGVTFAGYSPQEHTDLTLADLGIPGKAEKYAVYNYLLTNRIQPTSDWAPAAAEALNKKYNTDVYHAIDVETLGYGTEYVHSAPNGYGMLAGQYNPNATGEFFWGYV